MSDRQFLRKSLLFNAGRAFAMVFACGLLAACGGGGGGGETAPLPAPVTLSADVFPLAAGDTRTWRYSQGPRTGSLQTKRAGDATQLGALTVVPLRVNDGETEYLTRTASGIALVPSASDGWLQQMGPIEMLRFGQVAGSSIELANRKLSADIDGDQKPDSLDVRIESTFVGYETVTTPAGAFTGSARVVSKLSLTIVTATSIRVESNVISEEWYAPGVGLVRSVTTRTATAQPTEVEAQELVAYGVGSKHSETVAPTLTSTSPDNNAAVVNAPQSMQLNFSESLDPLSLDSAGGVELTTAAGQLIPFSRRLSEDGKSVTLAFGQALADGSYLLRLGGKWTDLANNAVAAEVRPFKVDTNGPKIISSTPSNGSDEASINGPIVLNFSEPIFAADGGSTVNIVLDSAQPLALKGLIQGDKLLINLDQPLPRDRQYYLSVASSLKDAAGNYAPYLGTIIAFKTGPGPLGRPSPLMANAWVNAVTVGDINGDGRPDIVFSASQTITSTEVFIAARLQQADGTYAEAVRLFTEPANDVCTPRTIALADVNGDGRADIINTGCFHGVRALVQQPSGSFAAEAVDTYTNMPALDGAIDLDGDGAMEIVVNYLTELRILRRSPAGVWSVALSVGPSGKTVNDFRLADINGDSQLDLVWLAGGPIGSPVGGIELNWALRQGNGFGAVHSQSFDLTLSPLSTFAVADVNGDGRADIVLWRQQNNGSEIAVLTQTITGSFAAPVLYPASSELRALDVGDVNGDGRADVLVTFGSTPTLGVFLQGADGKLEAERPFSLSQTNSYNERLFALDINKDGITDLVVGNNVLLGRPNTGAWPAALPGALRSLGVSTGAALGRPAVVQAPISGLKRQISPEHLRKLVQATLTAH